MQMDVWTQLTGNEDLLKAQYDVVAGRLPEQYNEVVLLVNEDNRITDYTLYTLGLLNAQALQDAVEAAARGEDVSIDTEVHSYSYDDILSLRFRLLTNTDCFVRQDGQWVDKSDDEAYLLNVLNSSDEIAVVGILRPAEGATTGSGQSGVIGYRADLMTHLLDKVTSAEIVREQKADPTVDVFTGLPFEQEELKDAYTMEELQAYAAQLPQRHSRSSWAMSAPCRPPGWTMARSPRSSCAPRSRSPTARPTPATSSASASPTRTIQRPSTSSRRISRQRTGSPTASRNTTNLCPRTRSWPTRTISA